MPLPRGLLTIPPTLYVLALLVGPIIVIGLYSVNMRHQYPGIPNEFSTDNWRSFLHWHGSPFFDRFKSSMIITFVVSVTAVAAAYPVAYYLAFVATKRRYTLLLAVLAPFFTSYLLRVIAWQIILNDHGVVPWILWQLHLEPHGQSPSWLIYSNFSVGLVLFYTWVPFVALPIFVVLENLDKRVMEASHDLGANGFTTFLRVTLAPQLLGRDGRLRVRAHPDHGRVHRAAPGGRPVQLHVRKRHPIALRRHR